MLQEQLSSKDFAEWMAYYAVEPFGEERADLRNAIVASTIANAYRDTKRTKKPFSPGDFMPEFDRVEEPATHGWQEQLGMVEGLNVLFGGADLRHGDDSNADRQDRG